MLNIQVLISCMYQEDTSIIQRTNVKSDVVVVNQCEKNLREEFDFYDSDGKKHHAIFISTKERGLSRSRNMAIENSTADICKICDDDEVLNDTYVFDILSAYEKFTGSDVIFFNFRGEGDRMFPTKKRVNYFTLLKAASIQITFKRKSIQKAKVKFDTLLGSGTGNGGGEENKFLLNCKRRKMKISSNSSYITNLQNLGESRWFNGFNEDYFFKLGWTSNRIFGRVIALFYILYFSISHRKIYDKKYSVFFVLKTMTRGFLKK